MYQENCQDVFIHYFWLRIAPLIRFSWRIWPINRGRLLLILAHDFTSGIFRCRCLPCTHVCVGVFFYHKMDYGSLSIHQRIHQVCIQSHMESNLYSWKYILKRCRKSVKNISFFIKIITTFFISVFLIPPTPPPL